MTDTTNIITSVNVETGITEQTGSETTIQNVNVQTEIGGLELSTTVTTIDVTTEVQIVEVSTEITTVEITTEVGASYVGMSAYDVWLQAWNVWSEQDFLDSLQWSNGAPGAWLPTGGVAGMVPIKQSSTNYDVAWWNLTTSDIIGLLTALANKEGTITAGTTAQYWRGDKTWQTLNKSAVGLSNVDNTSDAAKPISAAAQSALDLKADLVGGKVPISQLPSIVISDFLGVFTNTTAALANSGVQSSQRGDWFTVNTNGGETWIVTTDNPTLLAHITKVATPTDAVLTVTNSDGTLTITPTTWNVVASLNLAHANTWTAVQTILRTGLGTTTADGYVVDNTTAATSSVMQASPRIRRRGRGWLSNSNTSFPIDFADYVIGASGIVARGIYKMQWSGNGGSYNDAFTIDVRAAWNGFEFTTPDAQSNYVPGTTRAITINNSGWNTYTDYKFSGTVRAVIGATSSGDINIYTSGGNYFALWSGVAWSASLYSYSTPSQLYHSGFISANGGVHAGASYSPPSTLTSNWGTGFKTTYLTTNQTLTGSYTDILVNPDDNFLCSGMPSSACSSYSDQWSCEARNSHGGCTWNIIYCSSYNGNQSACQSTTGCTYDQADCSGPSDQTSCEAQNNSYGGSCAWTDSSPSCVWFDQWTCQATPWCSANFITCSNNYANCTPNYNGCTVNYTNPCSWDYDNSVCNGGGACSGFGNDADCNSYQEFSSCSGGGNCSMYSDASSCAAWSYFTGCGGGGSCSMYDESSCSMQTYWSGCSGAGPCSGFSNEYDCSNYSAFDNCSGNYSSYSCTGNYYTGNCSGTGGSCTGTASCANISETNCASETGCSASTGVTLTFPNDTWTGFYRFYRIKNKGSAANVTLVPYPWTSQTVNDTTSYSIAPGKTGIFTFFYFYASCGDYTNTDSSTCTTGHTGCTWNACAGRDEMSCTGNCTWNGSSCDGIGDCEGTWLVTRDWTLMGGVF